MYSLNHRPRRKMNKKAGLLALSMFAVLTVVGLGMLRHKKTNTIAPITSTGSPRQSLESIKSDQASGDERKEAISQTQGQTSQTPTNQSSNKKTVTPIIVFASASEVRVFIPSLVETGGTCTLSLSKVGATGITITQPGAANATTTDCSFAINPPASGWTAKVSYNSNTSQGQSEERTL